MNKFEIKNLKDVPQFAETCASWSYDHWGTNSSKRTFSKILDSFNKSCLSDDLPVTLVVINTETNTPIAMGSLLLKDGDDWPDIGPWIAYIYISDVFRGHGIAKLVIDGLEHKAKSLKYGKVFLHSSCAADMYKKYGYIEIDSVKTKKGTRVLLEKGL